MTVNQCVVQAFQIARASYPDLHKTWIGVSFRIGGLLPNSLLLPSVQRSGDIDMLLRAMEDEHVSTTSEESAAELSFHYQAMLSNLWIGDVYEILRLLKERKFADDDAFNALAHDFRLLRIPLEKHEIVEDRKLSGPLPMQTYPSDDENPRLRTYDKDDPKRAHIMPSGLSNRGSLMWLVFDHRTGSQFWLERRALSERMIALWQSASDA
jgi:hypothetical protein